MQSILNSDDDSSTKLEAIFPILIGKPCAPGDAHYPCTGNFFTDGSNHGMKHLVNAMSPNIANSVAKFLRKRRMAVDDDIISAPISTVVKDLFALQGAQLWNHGKLPEEDIAEESEVWGKVNKNQSDPPLDLQQLRMLKAEFRALVPGIHEVIDRAQAKAAAQRKKKDKIEARRKQLMQKVIMRMGCEALGRAFDFWRLAVGKHNALMLRIVERMSSDALKDAFQTWSDCVGEDERQLKFKLRSLPDTGLPKSASGNVCLPALAACCTFFCARFICDPAM